MNQVSLVLRESQAYQAYQEQRVSEGRQGLPEEVSEESLGPLDQRGNKVNQELEAQRGQRVTVETKETLEPWDQEAHLVKRGIKEPQRS